MKSNRILNINLVLTIFIVGLHSLGPKDAVPYLWFPRYKETMQLLFDTAVPAFFAISAFLLFRNYNMQLYTDKIRTRFYSLLIPYFLFSIIFGCIYLLVDYVKIGYFECNINDIIFNIIWARYNPPTWYLLTLFILIVLSPISYFAIRKSKYIGWIMCIILLIINLIHRYPYNSPIFWSPIFVFFSTIGYYYPNFFYKKRIFPFIGINLIIIVVFISFMIIKWNESETSNVYYLYRIFSPIFILSLSDFWQWKPSKINDVCFFIFLTHPFFIRLVKLPNDWFISTFARWGLAFIMAAILGSFLKRNTPRLWSIINGGR